MGYRFNYTKTKEFPYGYAQYKYKGELYKKVKLTKDGYIGNETHFTMGLKLMLFGMVFIAIIMFVVLMII